MEMRLFLLQIIGANETVYNNGQSGGSTHISGTITVLKSQSNLYH